MRKEQQDRLLRAAQDVVNDADNDGTSQVIVDREVFDDLRAIVKEISDDAEWSLRHPWVRAAMGVETCADDAVREEPQCWCSECNAIRRLAEESRPKRVIGCCYICGAEKVEGQENEFVWPDEDDEIQSPACERHLKESRASLFRVQLPDEGKEKPQDWIFTFGYDHMDSRGKRLWKRFVRIHGTFHEAREKMLERFGRAWAFQYGSEEDAGVAEWGLEEYKIDEQAEKESR